VGISTAINWVRRFRETGSVKPDQVGGYRPKKIAGAYRDWLVQRCRKADFTVRGLVAELAERGLKVDYRTMWEFLHAEKLSYKKRH
jgi:putative transposase